MTKIDKKIIDDINLISKIMEKNNLSEVRKALTENYSYKLKKNLNENSNPFHKRSETKDNKR